MNAKMDCQKPTDVFPGAIPEVCTNIAVLLVCAALATLTVTAALPMVPEALATPRHALDAEVAYVDERFPGQVIADWIDTVSEREFARSSD